MKSSLLVSLAVGGAFVQAAYDPDEHLILSDCGIGTLPNGASTSRQMMYYKEAPHGPPWQAPDMMVDVPWDGSYPWRETGVSRTMPNGDTFTAWINPDVPDYDANHQTLAGLAYHTYDSYDFSCYGSHGTEIYTLSDGTICTTAYICNHYDMSPSSSSSVSPTPSPSSPPQPTSTITTTISLSNTNIDVSDSTSTIDGSFNLVDPHSAFGNIFKDVDGQQCNGKPYAIGGGCDIIFTCDFQDIEGDPAGTTAQAMGTLLNGTAGPKIADTVGDWQTYSMEWGIPTYHRSYEYPLNGMITKTTTRAGDPGSKALQSSLNFNIECGVESGVCGSTCSGLTSAMVALGYAATLEYVGVLGTLIAGACAQCA